MQLAGRIQPGSQLGEKPCSILLRNGWRMFKIEGKLRLRGSFIYMLTTRPTRPCKGDLDLLQWNAKSAIDSEKIFLCHYRKVGKKTRTYAAKIKNRITRCTPIRR